MTQLRLPRHIASQLLLLTFGVAMPLLSGLAYFIYYDATQSKAASIERVRAMARDIANDSGAFLERAKEQIRYLAARAEVRALNPEHCDPMLTEMQRMNSIYTVIILTDAQGRTLCSSSKQPGPPPSYADREWFQAAMRSKGFRVGAPVVGRLTGTPVAPLTTPVLSPEGIAAGVLMFPASLREITRLVEKGVHLPTGTLITVVASNGTIVARSPDIGQLLGKDGRQILALARHIEQREGIDIAVGADGIVRLYGFTTIPEVEWLVSVGIPLTAVESHYRDKLMQSLYIAVAAFLSSLLFALLLAQRIRAPMRSLVEAARRASQGDLKARANVVSPTELAEVAQEFNRMLAVLAEADASLRIRNSQLDALNKELDAFSYSASHDLRGPLQTIDGFSRALLEDYGDKLDTEAHDYLQRIRGAVQFMGQLVDDLLKLSRLSRADMAINTVDLSAIAREVTATLSARDPARNVNVDIAPSVMVHGDPRLLTIVMENLLANAWKFTSRHAAARITFGIIEHDAERAFFVRDDGAGFDMTYVKKLFTPFNRLHTVSEFQGSGIGLALVRRIVQRHGGRVWGEGSPEHGATFYFTIPDLPAEALDTAKKEQP